MMDAHNLLDLMGEIDSAYIEDAANHLENSPRRFWQTLARPAAAAAIIGVIGFGAFTVAGVIRDGTALQNPPAGYTETAYSGTEPAETSANAATAVPPETLPTDLFVEMTDTTATTTVTTTVTEPAVTLTLPADSELPDASIKQEVNSRFLINWMSESGALAATVKEAHLYDNFEEAGLTFDDLRQSFRENYSFALNYDDSGMHYQAFPDSRAEKVNQAMQDYNFIKITLTLENLNAVSNLYALNNILLPDGSIRGDFAQTDDFSASGFNFFVSYNPESEPNSGRSFVLQPAAYFSLEGQLYDDDARRSMFRLPQGESITFELGGFLPKTADETTSHSLGYESGTNLAPYYCFGGMMARPYVEFHFTE